MPHISNEMLADAFAMFVKMYINHFSTGYSVISRQQLALLCTCTCNWTVLPSQSKVLFLDCQLLFVIFVIYRLKIRFFLVKSHVTSF